MAAQKRRNDAAPAAERHAYCVATRRSRARSRETQEAAAQMEYTASAASCCRPGGLPAGPAAGAAPAHAGRAERAVAQIGNRHRLVRRKRTRCRPCVSSAICRRESRLFRRPLSAPPDRRPLRRARQRPRDERAQLRIRAAKRRRQTKRYSTDLSKNKSNIIRLLSNRSRTRAH